MKSLYLVTYNAKYECTPNAKSIEGVTDNPEKWVENHNEEREADGQSREEFDEFDFDDISVLLFNNSIEVDLTSDEFTAIQKLLDTQSKEDWSGNEHVYDSLINKFKI